jgi:hypothetical protein
MGTIDKKKKKIEHDIIDACERVGRSRSEITVVAVTKTVSSKKAIEVMDAGYIHLGENRPETLLEKVADIKEGPVWHFIGNIQSRRVKDFINEVHCVHSVDRISVAKEIHKRAIQPIDCFVQVNVSGEDSKSGIKPDELQPFIESIAQYDKVRIIGLMTMAPLTEDRQVIRNVFKALRKLRDKVSSENYLNAPCTQLSMGMSNDYVIAIEEGATHVRIGSALVGSESEGDT